MNVSGGQIIAGQCVTHAFEAAAEANDQLPAIEVLGAGPGHACAEVLTYRAVSEAAARLAGALARRDVAAGGRVGIAPGCGASGIVAMLAILRLGGTYVPLPADLGREALAALCTEADLACLLAPATFAAPEGLACHDPAALMAEQGPAAPVCARGPEAVAYIMFTSGSTGRPKGVIIPDRAILRLVVGQDFMELGPSERILQAAPLAFDASTLEIWGALLNGGTLVLPRPGPLSLPDLSTILVRGRISTLWLTAGLFHAMADLARAAFAPLRQLLTGGDVVSPAHVARVAAACPDLVIRNGYGPTENTTFTCVHEITAADLATGLPLPIGRPIRGTQVYVLDEDGAPVADGIEGELHVAGEGLALGYLGDPGLTSRRFVQASWDPCLRLYRTGDLVCRANGVVHFVGRADGQVKLRGYRVELAGIEAALATHPAIARAGAALVTRDDTPGDGILVAHVVARGAFPGEAALRDHLARMLPAHAVPARIVAATDLPVGPTGKLDRRALAVLPEPGAGQGAGQGLAGRIAALLAEMTGQPVPDLEAGFFDLGATSLHLMRLHARLVAELGREFPIADLFAHASPALLARHLGAEAGATPTPPTAQGMAAGEPIAIIAMAGRFPGAPDIPSFWKALLEGRELISHFSPEDLDYPAPEGAILARGVLEDAEMFDAAHFGVSPREADRMDPQHRVLLELAQQALDEAGHDPDRFAGRIGLFAGASQNSYLLANLVSAPGAARALAAGYPVSDTATLFGNDKDFLCTRVAHRLNLRGPAMAVQAACATSLLAVAQACDALRAGAADMALAGGVSITFPARRGYAHAPGGMASADGHCRAFDARASGTVFGDGAGLVLLRPLSAALADGDRVLVVIRGWGVGNDGAAKAGFAAPNPAAQAEVIAAAQDMAGVGPEDIGYIEAHGTGTSLGDPIEIAALTTAFRGSGDCLIGTAKTHVGHLDIAAGVTGLVKTVQSLREDRLIPLLHFEKANPAIDFAATPFRPVTEAQPFPRRNGRRRAGVSAFGIGGTNVHLVLEEAPNVEMAEVRGYQRPLAFPVSATSPAALDELTARLGAWAEGQTDVDPLDVARGLAGRRAHPLRRVLVASDMGELARAARSPRPARRAANREAVFVFPGQGAQRPRMGQGLRATHTVFRESFDICAEILRPHMGLDLVALLAEDDTPAVAERLRDTAVAQPALLAFSYALARQWQDWGVKPAALAGHSVGEFAAAVLAGIMRLEDALALVALRGRLMAAQAPGAMLAVRLPEADIAALLGAELALAAVNGPHSCVVAGPVDAIEALSARLQAGNVPCRRLETSHAFHSPMVEPAVAPFRAALEAVTLAPPSLPVVSTVTGLPMTVREATSPDYWAAQMRLPVRFHDAVAQVASSGAGRMLLEVGPGASLVGPMAQAGQDVVALGSLMGDGDEARALAATAGDLWSAGVALDWGRVLGPGQKAQGLPAYPFQRRRHWVAPWAGEAVPEAPLSEETTTEPTPAPVARSPSTGEALRALLAEVSGFAPRDLAGEASFLAMGFDSLLLTQVAREVGRAFGVEVPLRALIEQHGSIDRLAAHIDAVAPAGARTERKAMPSAATAATAEGPVAAPALKPEPMAPQVTPRQRAHIDRLVARFTARTPGSKAFAARHRTRFADPRSATGFNPLWKEAVYQIVTERALGSRLIDVDGNEYVDILQGFGPGFIGHSPPAVVAAMEAQVSAGFEVGPQSRLAMEAAEMFCALTGAERASFVCTGSEAVAAALRIARTVTGRDRIVTFARDYHGNFDEVLLRAGGQPGAPVSLPLAPGIPREALANITVLPYGTDAAFEWIAAHIDEIAGVLVEPVQSRRPEFRPVDFLHRLRRLTEANGALLIFDEVVTGFRLGPRGAQGLFGIEADLATYGKVVGGGLPVGVVAGRAAAMDTFDGGDWRYGDDSRPAAPVTFFAGTFVRHPLAMAATHAMLRDLGARSPLFWQEMAEKGAALAGGLDAWFCAEGLPLEMPHCGSLMYLRLPEGQPLAQLMGLHLRARGVFMLEGFPSYLSAAHDADDLAFLRAAMMDAAEEMRADGLFEGIAPRDQHHPQVEGPEPRLCLTEGPAAIRAAMTAPTAVLRLPSTESQREIFAAVALDPGLNAAYNESVTLGLDGDLDRDALEEAVRRGLARHDAFRAGFSPDGQEMELNAACAHDLRRIDLTGLPEAARDDAWAQLLRAEAETPFDLATAPLVRAALVTRAARVHRLVITAHHIVCDGWSIDVVIRDIGLIYEALAEGRGPGLPPAQSIIDYARAEAADPADADLAFWRGVHAGPPVLLDLPTDHPRRAARGLRGGRVDGRLGTDRTAALRGLAAREGLTLAGLLLGAWALYLARIGEAEEIVVGMPAAGQAVRGMPGVVGHCVNLLPLRLRVERERPVVENLRAVQRHLLDAQEHQRVTYARILRETALPRSGARAAAVPVVFNSDNGIDLSALAFGDAALSLVTNPRSHEHFELYLNVTVQGRDVTTEWSFNADLFTEASVRAHAARFETLLDRIVAEPEKPVGAVALVTEAEAGFLAQHGAGAPGEMPRGETIASLFVQQARATRDATALIEGDARISYAVLEGRMAAYAQLLARKGIVAGDLVGVCLPRGASCVAAILAVQHLGAAWLPLDPSHPPARLAHVLDDAKAAGVLCDEPGATALKAACLPQGSVLIAVADAEMDAPLPAAGHHPQGLAYVLYTSGSTGAPKGVMATQEATLNRFAWMWRAFPFAPGEVLALKTGIAFGDSMWEMFGPLLAGMTLAVIDDETRADPPRLMAALGRLGVTRLVVVPSLLREIVAAGPEVAGQARMLSTIFTSGEALDASLVRAARASLPDVRLVNLYGSSEVAADVTCADLSGDIEDPVPIGRPIDNVTLTVLDRFGAPVPPGLPGILHVGGVAVAAGYLHRPDLTAARFRPDPVRPGGRLFDTGDLVRFLPNGRLVYLGRRDDQVKIRGFRVELGEIDAAITACADVHEAAVVEEGGQIVAFYTGVADPAELRRSLARRLPDYMLPARLVPLAALLLNPSGKTDRRALAALALAPGAAPASATPAVSSAAERDLAAVWARLLGREDIPPDADFFDLGGHSLLAVRLFAHIRRAHGLDLPIGTLFAHPTLAALAAHVEAEKRDGGDAGRDDWDSTIIIHPGPTADVRPPLFIVGGVGGNVNNLVEVGRHLGARRAVIGLQTRGVAGHAMHESIEAMAAEHLAHIARRQPSGPLHLAGYSGGAWTAYEIARLAQASGREIAFLGVLDMYAPGSRPPRRTGGGLGRALAALGAGPTAWRRRLWPRLRETLTANPLLPVLAPLMPEYVRLVRLARLWRSVAARYRPEGALETALWLHLALERGEQPACLGWDGVVTGPVTLSSQVSDHVGMLEAADGLILAMAIAQALGDRDDD